MPEHVLNTRPLAQTPWRALVQTPRSNVPQGQQGRRPNTLLRPWEFDFVHDVFKRIISEPWFSRDRSARSAFALQCLRTYQAGTDTDQLYRTCERLARDSYINPS